MAISARITFTRNPDVVYQMQWATGPTPGEIRSWVDSLPIFRSKNGIARKLAAMVYLGAPRSESEGIVLEIRR